MCSWEISSAGHPGHLSRVSSVTGVWPVDAQLRVPPPFHHYGYDSALEKLEVTSLRVTRRLVPTTQFCSMNSGLGFC